MVDVSDWVLNNAIGFVGIGKAANSFSDFDRVPSRVARGIGFRYKVARKLGMHAGIDVAQGPEDTYWYIQIGSAWLNIISHNPFSTS